MKFVHTLKFKLIITTILCTAVVSLAGNLFLYNYLTGIINEKAAHIDEIYLSTMRSQLDSYLEDLSDLGILCANDTLIVTALEQRTFSSSAMRAALQAQTQLNAYLASSPINDYVEVIAAFNTDGLFIAGASRAMGDPYDFERVTAQPVFEQVSQMPTQPIYRIVTANSIKKGHRNVLVILCPLRGVGATPGRGYIYVELSLDLVEEVVAPYSQLNDIFVAAADGTLLTHTPPGYPEGFTAADLAGEEVQIGDKIYAVSSEPLCAAELRLYHCMEKMALDQEGTHILYTVLVVLLISLLLAVVLAALVSAYLSRPISRLDARLRRIASNDFSFDPEIEKPSGELGQIGRTVNEMTMSIENLLQTTESMYNQRRNIEIQLLQSQVNPHFLYNTLDSIRWMALIQKNTGIENMTRSLSNLLKNIAKGTQDKITIEEELSLLQDYVAIQTVRYMEVFSFENKVPPALYQYRIIKLTLQPLVENALFHGIEPTGECGTITVTAREDGEDLLLCVEDSGIGIPAELLATILSGEHKRNGASLNGIGIANVHKRLQLVYGEGYGLTVESKQGEYTRVIVRIPKER